MNGDPGEQLARNVDRLARLIHEQYVRDRVRRGDTSEANPSLVAWDHLPEVLRQSNRAQARHIPTKLAAAGCHVTFESAGSDGFAFTADELERLARLEHDRWWLDQLIADWTSGPNRSAAARTSPFLVPWSELPEHVQENDRDAVRALPDLLASVGLRIVRAADAAQAPSDLLAMLGRCVPEFVAARPRFDELGQRLVAMLRDLSAPSAPTTIVTARSKSVAGFVDKIVRKYPKYQDPMREITDLCGVRVIARTRTEIDAIAERIEGAFVIDAGNSLRHNDRLHPSQFGYRSVHYIVSIPCNVDLGTENQDLHDLKAEIQVRTVAEHASADFDHDLSYKGSFALPDRWQRELAMIAAQVESIDEAFVRIEDGVRVYANSYGASLDAERLRQEIAKLRTICTFAPEDSGLTLRLARLLRASGSTAEAQRLLDEFCDRNPEQFVSPFVDEPQAAILHDLGAALCEQFGNGSNEPELQRGRALLEQAGTALVRPSDKADAFACLGDSWGQVLERHVWHDRAFAIDAGNPHALTRYIESRIGDRGADVVAMLSPAIDHAITRCRAQIEVRQNLPRAYAFLGELLMLRAQSFAGLDLYAKSLRASTAPRFAEDALCALDTLVVESSSPVELEWARRMLLLGLLARFRSPKRAAELVALASREPGQLNEFVGPVVIVAGWTSKELATEPAAHDRLLVEAFRDFTGTIVSGGTEQGISGIVGRLGTYDDQYPARITTIGYVPDRLPPDGTATHDNRYTEIRNTDGATFGPDEPLQMWVDLLVSGIAPAEVTVLGIGGGDIAGFELRLALALGARVGVVVGSGRAVDTLLGDAEWADLVASGLPTPLRTGLRCPRQLMALPADAETVRAFIGGGQSVLTDDDREQIARMIHTAYVDEMREHRARMDPLSQPFDSLPEEVRESNLRQADNIGSKVREIGCSIVRSGSNLNVVTELDAREVERWAEMEHGRWCAEKLADGFVFGQQRDDVARTHPYLVPWTALPAQVKEQNRAAVREIPEQLAAAGLVITRDPS